MKTSKLGTALSVAVPLRIDEWKRKGGPAQADFEEIQDNCLEKLMERGDILLYGGGNKGECANIFNQVANAIAIMSFLPGGIKIFGRMWISCAK